VGLTSIYDTAVHAVYMSIFQGTTHEGLVLVEESIRSLKTNNACFASCLLAFLWFFPWTKCLTSEFTIGQVTPGHANGGMIPLILEDTSTWLVNADSEKIQ
jgi:hypothetical protein